MAQHQVPWGTITLNLDNEAFRRGYLSARQWYLEDICGEDGRPPEEPQRAFSQTNDEMLGLVAMPDEQGRYHFDQMGGGNLPEYLEDLIGYPAARLHRKKQRTKPSPCP